MNTRTENLRLYTDVISLDKRSLGLFRILIAVLVLVDLYERSLDLTRFYTDLGVLPIITWEQIKPLYAYSIYQFLETPLAVALAFGFTALCALMVLIGFQTKWFVALLWYMMVSLVMRNPHTVNSADALLCNLLLISLFLPIDERFALHSREIADPRTRGNKYYSIFSVLFIVQLLILYFMAAYIKTGYREGVYYALNLCVFAKSTAQIILPYPVLGKAFTYGSLLLEYFGWVFLFFPYRQQLARTLVCFAFMSFHFGLFIFMQLGLFPWIAIIAWVAMLPASFWDFLGVQVSSAEESFVPGAWSRLFLWHKPGWLPKLGAGVGVALTVGVVGLSFGRVGIIPTPHWLQHALSAIHFEQA
ncbi:MAG: HTTM domain-containing protein, partial [Cytophagales bacterium]|nr:HTTM domain-containing protein [Cytophagales bacterium]